MDKINVPGRFLPLQHSQKIFTGFLIIYWLLPKQHGLDLVQHKRIAVALDILICLTAQLQEEYLIILNTST
jgi:hypothetical protein